MRRVAVSASFGRHRRAGRLACKAVAAIRGGELAAETNTHSSFNFALLSRFIEARPLLGTATCALCYIGIELAGLPSSPIAVFLGANYPIPAAIALASGSGLVSAIIAFQIGRTKLRQRYLYRIEHTPKLRAISLCIRENDFLTILLLRFVPVPPIINYVYGATAATLRGYSLATLLGNLPGTLICIFSTHGSQNHWQVGVCVLAVFLYASVVAGRTMRQKLASYDDA